MVENSLVLNVTKTVYITFGNYSDSIPSNDEIQNFINGQSLTRVDNYIYLGVIYDWNIGWALHINKIVYLVYVFYRLKHSKSKKQLLQIYYGLFHSNAVYGMIGWSGIYPTALDPLVRLQNRLLKIIEIDDQDPLKPLGIRQVFILNSMCKQYNDLKSEYVQYPINTRYKSVEIPKHHLAIGKKSYSYLTKDYFNKIPNNLKDLSVIDKLLKKKIKEEIKKPNVI